MLDHRSRIRPGRQSGAGRLERKPLVVDIDDPLVRAAHALGDIDYEAFLADGDPAFPELTPADEWDAIALNYTSGTTGNPKGVVYHHRGAYLNALGNILVWGLRQHPVYLWTLPMFHCNGWCFPWAVTALAGTHVCLRRVEAGGDLRDDRARRRHPSVRRADRDEHAAERRPELTRSARPADRDDDRRGVAAGGGHRGDGSASASTSPMSTA